MVNRPSVPSIADSNRKRFIGFRVLFNSRFYYPVLAVLFLDLGLSATQYTLLNFVWAIVIVAAEVPSGALADRIGRRPLIVASAVCMVLEMSLLLAAPVNGGLVLLLFCLANRMFSGLAEALASGADESLAYESLAAEAREKEWPDLMAEVMHWQSLGLCLAMLVGAAVYDPHLVNNVLATLGSDLRIDQGIALRIPIALNLISAIVVLWLALGMREPAAVSTHAHAANGWQNIVDAGVSILRTPVALFVILGGVLIDSVIRLFLTFGSAYYRLIDLPEASFGFIGAAMAGLGMLVAPLAKHLVRSRSLLRNFLILTALTLAGLAVLGMSAATGWVDGTPVLPQGAREWREFIEYAASIGFSYLTGMLLGRLLRLRRRAAVRQASMAVALTRLVQNGGQHTVQVQQTVQKFNEFGGAMIAAATTVMSIYTGLKGVIGS